jgi:hypothetical protein
LTLQNTGDLKDQAWNYQFRPGHNPNIQSSGKIYMAMETMQFQLAKTVAYGLKNESEKG